MGGRSPGELLCDGAGPDAGKTTARGSSVSLRPHLTGSGWGSSVEDSLDVTCWAPDPGQDQGLQGQVRPCPVTQPSADECSAGGGFVLISAGGQGPQQMAIGARRNPAAAETF